MSDKQTVRIGVKSARELEVEVEDPSAVRDAFERALKKDESVLWITDTRGHHFGVATASIAFIEIEHPEDRGVGFGSQQAV